MIKKNGIPCEGFKQGRLTKEELTEKIEHALFHDYKQCEFLFPFTHGNLEQYFRENSHVYEVAYLENGIKDCSNCKLPHIKDKGYDYVMKKWENVQELIKK